MSCTKHLVWQCFNVGINVSIPARVTDPRFKSFIPGIIATCDRLGDYKFGLDLQSLFRLSLRYKLTVTAGGCILESSGNTVGLYNVHMMQEGLNELIQRPWANSENSEHKGLTSLLYSGRSSQDSSIAATAENMVIPCLL